MYGYTHLVVRANPLKSQKKAKVMRTSTTVSDTFGDGMIENVESILSGNSCSIHMRGQNVDNNKDTTSRNFDRSRDPRPAPVPPPSEWINWNPWRASHASACLRTAPSWLLHRKTQPSASGARKRAKLLVFSTSSSRIANVIVWASTTRDICAFRRMAPYWCGVAGVSKLPSG